MLYNPLLYHQLLKDMMDVTFDGINTINKIKQKRMNKDNNTPDNFVWNDELVIEIVKDLQKGLTSGITDYQLYLKNMKEILTQSKQQPVDSNKVGIIGFSMLSGSFRNPAKNRENYTFTTVNGIIPEEKYEGLKLCISEYLNGGSQGDKLNKEFDTALEKQFPLDIPTLDRQGNYIQRKEPHPDEAAFIDMIYQRNVQNSYSKDSQSYTAYEKGFEECWNHFFNINKPEDKVQDKEVGWEIQSFEKLGSILKLENGKYRDELNSIGLDSALNQFKFPIHSVKRLSDNTVFTIGDKIGWGIEDSFESVLTGFEIEDGILKFYDEKLPKGRLPCSFLDAINLHRIYHCIEKTKNEPKQMWNKYCGIHDENHLCMEHGCEEYNPLDKSHTIKE